ncbi:MAG: rod shape-determining protein RodA [Nitrospinota bacterium]
MQVQIKRGLFANIDFTIFLIALSMTIIGIVAIYSANLHSEELVMRNLYKKQIIWLLCAITVFLITLLIDYRIIERYTYVIFIIAVMLLVCVEFFGNTTSGSQRWIDIGVLKLQPSETMKIAIILLVARVYDSIGKDKALGFFDMLKPFILVMIPFLLVAKQPDLGTAVVYLVILIVVTLLHGTESRILKLLGAITIVFGPLSWLLLKGYQKKRILAFLNPESDPMGSGYQVIQSKIAIGSGGIVGKGIFNGTQSKLNFLPEKHTDFIFSVIAEETGFIGIMILFFLFATLIFKLIAEATNSRDLFGAMVISGVMTLLVLHFFYKIVSSYHRPKHILTV